MKPLILLVDDEEDILDFLERILKEQYTILKAENGKEAMHILKEEAVQLIICDIMMPIMDGFQLCRVLKEDFNYSHIPFILLTAKNTIQSKVKGLELSADAYIEKPFSKEHLFAQITSLLTNRNSVKEYFAQSPLVHIKSMAHSKSDELFLEAMSEKILEKIDETDLNVDKLSSIMNMSRITLYRKIKAISNMSPIELINIIRLRKAAELLAKGDYKIYEISDMVGYSSQSHFSRNFLKQFQMTPSDYIHSLSKNE